MVPVSPPISKKGRPSCSLTLSEEQGITCGFLESSTNSLICEVMEPNERESGVPHVLECYSYDESKM